MIKTNTQTITLDGTEQEVRFNRNYPYFWVQNQGYSDVLMSINSGIAEGKDGVMTVLSGGTACTMHGYDLDRFYLMGTGKVQVVGTYSAHCPFKPAQGGGDNTASGATYYSLANAADYPILGINLYGKSTQDGTPTPENPVDIVSVGDGGSVGITACGKNLVDPSKITTGGFNYDTGAEFNNSGRARTGYIAVTPTYLIGSVPDGYSILSIYHYTATKEYLGVGGASLLKGQNGFIRLLLKRTDGAAITDDDLNTLKISLIVTNNESVEYEPYKDSTASITTALPLCSVGDVCDELIYNADGTGKIVKHIGKYTFTGNESFALRGNRDNMYMYSVTNALQFKRGLQAFIICDKYKNVGNAENWQAALNLLSVNEICVWNNTDNCTVYFGSSCTGLEDFKAEIAGATVVYQLPESQEIELSAAEMAALRELRTYSGITNLSNDVGADMDVKYCTNNMLAKCVMPVITSLQAQIDELNAAILSMGSNV